MLPVIWSHKRYFFTAWIATFLAILIGLASPLVVRRRSTLLSAGDLAPVRPLVLSARRRSRSRDSSSAIVVTAMHDASAAYGIEYDLRAIIYEHLTRMSFGFYDRVQSGQLISRANSDIRSVQMFLAFAPTMVIQFVTFFVALAFMLTIHPLLTLVRVLPMPAVVVRRHEDAQAHVPDLVDRAGAAGRGRDDRRREHHRRPHREVVRRGAAADPRARDRPRAACSGRT